MKKAEEMKKNLLEEKQVRFMPIETRADEESEEKVLEGYALKFENYTKMGGYWEYYEVIDRQALDEADMSDVVLNFNHNNDIILGRTTSGTLTLTKDDVGLKFRCVLPDTQQANDLYKQIKRGDISKCSFAFTIADSDWTETKDELEVFRIKKIKRLYDVSVVTFPAYEDTNVDARSLQNQSPQINKRKQLAEKIRKEILINKIKGGF